ncbi:MAG: energy transducer TonB [Aestuariibaculum sp.]
MLKKIYSKYNNLNLSNRHKAILITILLSGTLLLSVFNIHLQRYQESISESYYELEPEKELTEEELKLIETLEKLNNTKAETNQAFNKTQDHKHFAQAYKSIAPPEDYTPKKSDKNNGQNENTNALGKTPDNIPDIKKEELSAFSKVNEILEKHKNNGVNTKSTIYYSLVNRKHTYLPIPIYLCETGGKIVVNITVNDKGNVIDAYINNSSDSNNECLKERALEYAKEAKFNTAPGKKKQLGSITFHFIGKS